MSSRDYKEGFKISGLWLVFGAVGIIGALLLTAMAVFGFGIFAKSTANFRGSVSQANLTQANGSYRIATYNHFFDICASVQTDETAVRTLMKQEHRDTGQQKSIDAQDANANIIDRARLINQYNADAAKTATQSQFLASNLPYHLYISTKETQCTP